MKAIVYSKYGPPEVLHLKEIDKPSPKPNEILVKIHSTTVTTWDVRLRKAEPFLVRFFFGFFKPKKNILGGEFAGEIESVGEKVTQFTKGERVFGSAGVELGSYCEFKCIPEDGVVASVPGSLTYDEAAAVPFGALTSLHFLRKGNVAKGQKVLVYGASGNLGTAAVQLAKNMSAEVTGVCGPTNVKLVKSLGADKVIDYTKEDFSENGVTYDVIFDTIGKSPFSGSVKSLKDGGYYLRAVNISPSSLIKGLWTKITSRKKVVGGTSEETKENLIFLKELIKAGKFKPVIDRKFPLEQIAAAHRYVDKGHKKGSVVITIKPGK
jgi:NADPH:quinone reductase-like Zn-dependent oxidoreductase